MHSEETVRVRTDEIEIPAAKKDLLKARKGVLGVTTRGDKVFLAIGEEMTPKERDKLKKDASEP